MAIFKKPSHDRLTAAMRLRLGNPAFAQILASLGTSQTRKTLGETTAVMMFSQVFIDDVGGAGASGADIAVAGSISRKDGDGSDGT